MWFQNRRMKWRHAQQQQGDKEKQDTNSVLTAGEQDETRKYHIQAGGSPEKGLDLRRMDVKEEACVVDIETSVCEVDTRECSTDDVQSKLKTAHEQCFKPDGMKASSFMSPIVFCDLEVPKETDSRNPFTHTVFTSTPKSKSKNSPSLAESGDRVFVFESKKTIMSPRRHQMSRSPINCDMHGEAEYNPSTVMQKTSLAFQDKSKTKYTGLDNETETVPNDTFGIKLFPGTREMIEDTGPGEASAVVI